MSTQEFQVKSTSLIEDLQHWMKTQKGLDDKVFAFMKLVDANSESPLISAIDAMSNSYTDLTARLVRDKCGWLDWFQFECEFGASPKEAVVEDVRIEVDSLEKLAWVIEKTQADSAEFRPENEFEAANDNEIDASDLRKAA